MVIIAFFIGFIFLHVSSAVFPYFFFVRRFSSSVNETGDLELLQERLLSPMRLVGHFLFALFVLYVYPYPSSDAVKTEESAEADSSDNNSDLLNWLTAIGMEKYYSILIEKNISMKEMNKMSQSSLQKIIKNGDDARDIMAEFMKLP